MVKKPLTPAEVQQRMRQWEEQGFDTAGFDLSDGEIDDLSMPGQSRQVYPDLEDVRKEQQSGEVRVFIPDKKAWDHYVKQRMEEKLRALGVTRGDEDSGVASPPMPNMSRQASVQNSKASSVAGAPAPANALRHGRENTFSPPLSGASSHITRPSSLIQPHNGQLPHHLGNHFPMQSVAFQGEHMVGHGPPFQPQPTPPLSGPWPQNQYLGSLPGSRDVSPLIDGRPIRGAHSPISPLGEQLMDGYYTSSNPSLSHLQHAPNQPQLPPRPPQQPHQALQRQIKDLQAREPSAQPLRFISQPEIASPLPQGHRHNLSENLQKEIDEAENDLEESIQQQLEDEKPKVTAEDIQGRHVKSPAQPDDRVEANLKEPNTAPEDVQTNPSIGNSPRLSLADMNPKAPEFRSRASSVAKLTSKLNVGAPEFKFDPTKASFTPVFTFGSQAASTAPRKPSQDTSKSTHSRALSTTSTVGSQLNVAAPAFTPGQFQMPPGDKREFSFTSAMPKLQPEATEPKSDADADRSLLGGEPSERPRMFARINYSDVIKPAKKSRAIPIVKPRFSDNESDYEAADHPEDDAGRIGPPEGRQKRLRRGGGSGDEVPRFATPSRDVSAEPLQEAAAQTAAVSTPQNSTPNKRARAPTLEESPTAAMASSARKPGNARPISRQATPAEEDISPVQNETQSIPVEEHQPFITEVSPLTPESPARSLPQEKVDEESRQRLASMPDGQTDDSQSAVPKSSTLSATAKPFEFNPNVNSFNPSQSFGTKQPSGSAVDAAPVPAPPSVTTRVISGAGLEGSRFAPAAGLEGSKFAPPSASMDQLKVKPQETAPQELENVSLESESLAESVVRPEQSLEARIANGVHYVGVPSPSYQEIDDVMKHLNGDDSDIGVERNPAQVWRSPARSGGSTRIKSPTRERSITRDNVDSDPFLEPARPQERIPSASPNRLKEPFQYLPKHESADSDKANALAEMVARNARFSPSYKRPRNPTALDSPIRRASRRADDRSISEWDDVVSSDEEIGFRARTGFFDNRVHELLGDIVDTRLRPLEQTLATMNSTLVRMNDRPGSRRLPRSTSAEVEKSDADDEDEERPVSRAYSPVRDRKFEKLKTSLLESIASQKPVARDDELAKVSQELQELRASLKELKQQPQGNTPEVYQDQHKQLLDAVNDLKKSVPGLRDSFRENKHRPTQSTSSPDTQVAGDDATRKQSRGKSAPVMSSREAATVDKLQLKVDGLESMLKTADSRADDELRARQKLQEEVEVMTKRWKDSEAEAAVHRESAEETEQSLRSILDGQQQAKQHSAMLEEVKISLEKSVSDLTEKSAALEETLEEYRISHDTWKKEMDEAKTDNENLQRTISSLKSELEDGIASKGTLKEKLGHIQQEMASTARSVTENQASSRQKIEEFKAKCEHQSARLEAEARTRERLELEIDRLEKQEKNAMKSRFVVEQVKAENTHLITSVNELRTKGHHQHERILGLERELHDAKESNQSELQRAFNSHKGELESSNQRAHLMRANLEAVISRLEGQLQYHKDDIESSKQRHEFVLEEASASKSNALREAAEAREAALQEHYRFHERTLEETRASHERSMEELKVNHQQAISSLVADHDRALKGTIEEHERVHNVALEEKRLTQSTLNERLSLADQKASHYQDRISHLEERLELAQSAAQAAAAAAKSARAGPAPAASPVSGNKGSMAVPTGSSIPDKISPQALRESILVLQEQLRDRENQIEKLEGELGKVDHDAPKKIKERELEISWLRELLGVRLDELGEITATLASPSFDREAVRNAAIRLRANLEMERQEKERALAGGGTPFPSLASITASPRALPLAAAAAWGNWRKGRASVGGPAEMAATGSSPDQTPSRASPQSLLSGLLTPPNTQVRGSPSRARGPPRQAPRPGTAQSARHLPPHGFSTPPRPSSQGKAAVGRATSPSPHVVPETPTLLRTASYDLDAESTHYSLDHYVSAATEDEAAVGLDEVENESPEGETADGLHRDTGEHALGPSIELES